MTANPTFYEPAPGQEAPAATGPPAETATTDQVDPLERVTEGWYVDPERADRVRWWNGGQWTSRIGGEGNPISWHAHLGELPPPQPGTRIFSIVRDEAEPTAAAPEREPVAEVAKPAPTPICAGVHAPSRFHPPAPLAAARSSEAVLAVVVAPSRMRQAARRILVAAATMAIALSGAATAAVLLR